MSDPGYGRLKKTVIDDVLAKFSKFMGIGIKGVSYGAFM
jgi:hypothetical protein